MYNDVGLIVFRQKLYAVARHTLTALAYMQAQHANSFLPARRYASAGLCDSDVSVRQSVCLSVRTSVCHTLVLCLAERKQDREMYTI